MLLGNRDPKWLGVKVLRGTKKHNYFEFLMGNKRNNEATWCTLKREETRYMCHAQNV